MVPGNNGRDDLQAVGAEDRTERREGARGKASGDTNGEISGSEFPRSLYRR